VPPAPKTKKTVKEPRLGRRTAAAHSPGPEELARIALTLFAERHFALVTIKDIAAAANVNSAMIYYHFKNKDDLFKVAIENAIDGAFSLFDDHRINRRYNTAADAISAWFDVHVTLHRQLRNVVKISLDCAAIANEIPEAVEPIKRFYRHEKEILEGLIRSGMEDGTFRAVSPHDIATIISTFLDGTLARSLILDDFDMTAAVHEFKRGLLLHLVKSD